MNDDSTADGPGTGEGGEENLESRLRRLEEIVGQLETEELELDRALALFEEGVAHVKEANKALAAAELRVEELLGEDGSTRPLDEDEG
ncbi:MAG: exodeoxyribonuclease VII small subunit [Gemmatimonadota bacterium]|jgi:exodeoxyribonuclease VII small subunit